MKEIQEFITEKAGSENKSDQTVANYKRWLLEFCNILEVSDIKEFLALDADDLRRYVRKLQAHGNQSSSIWTKAVAIQSFYTYLIDKKLCKINIMKEIVLPKRRQKEFTPPSNEQVFSILKAMKDNKAYFTLTSVLYQSGLRISEALSIKVSDFYKNEVKVIGKGDKERTVYFSQSMMDIINDYIENDRHPKQIVSEEEFVKLELNNRFKSYEHYCQRLKDAEGLLFLTKNGVRMDIANIGVVLKQYAVKAGIDLTKTKISPHKLRTAFATDGVLKKGIPLPTMQSLLGHARIETTMRYMKVNPEIRREAYGMVSDIGDVFK